jgi:lysophospholipase L1-like esterase
MPPAARELLYDLFMKPRTLGADDFARLMSDEEFTKFNTAGRGLGNLDWPNLCRFRAANHELQARGASPQVVFMGDSITENWSLGDADFFNETTVNRGIGGQTTPQMLLRFRADVVALQPEIVHIMTGTNDVAGNTGPTTMQDYKNNIMSMVELAQANNIKVILGSVLPAAEFNWQPSLNPVPTIAEMNAWLRDYAKQNKLGYVDYFSALTGPNGDLNAKLGNDGVHPNRDGYVIMRKLVEKQLATFK